MSELTVDLTIQVETALSVGAGGSAGTLADKAVIRNRKGRLILPGSQLKGRLRHACEVILRSQGHAVCESPRAETMCPQLAPQVPAPCRACALFGSPGYPATVRFADLAYADLSEEEWLRPGVAINRRRRVAEEDRLYLVETSPPGALAEFKNSKAIVGQVADGQAELLLAGLTFLYTWGGGKSRGLGWARVRAVAHVAGQPDLVLDTTDLDNPIYVKGLEVIVRP